ncbi:MAG: hypothetical protein Q9M91_04735 [Candidatus Dojkabacteria bacterium]|nr:hypothetical protein [Candidatus Dojkabacteria bacterium]
MVDFEDIKSEKEDYELLTENLEDYSECIYAVNKVGETYGGLSSDKENGVRNYNTAHENNIARLDLLLEIYGKFGGSVPGSDSSQYNLRLVRNNTNSNQSSIIISSSYGFYKITLPDNNAVNVVDILKKDPSMIDNVLEHLKLPNDKVSRTKMLYFLSTSVPKTRDDMQYEILECSVNVEDLGNDTSLFIEDDSTFSPPAEIISEVFEEPKNSHTSIDDIYDGIIQCEYADRQHYKSARIDRSTSEQMTSREEDANIIHSYIFGELYNRANRFTPVGFSHREYYNARIVYKPDEQTASMFIQYGGIFYKLTLQEQGASDLVELLKTHPHQIQAIFERLELPVDEIPRYTINLAEGPSSQQLRHGDKGFETFVDQEKREEIHRNLIPVVNLVEDLAAQSSSGEVSTTMSLEEVAGVINEVIIYGKPVLLKNNPKSWIRRI